MTISAQGTTLSLGGRAILRGVYLEVADRAMLAIVGPNGSGKSTFVRAISGALRPDGGTIRLDGELLTDVARRAIARRLAVVLQSAPTPPLITVREHVWLGRHPHRGWMRGPVAADRRLVDESLQLCDVAVIADRLVETLSGGERQRVRLATALAQDTPHLILDEPLTGLDVQHQLDLVRLLRRVNEERGTTIIAVLHDLDLAVRHFPLVALFDKGRVVAHGPPRAVFTPAAFADVFRVDGRISHDATLGEAVVVCRPLA